MKVTVKMEGFLKKMGDLRAGLKPAVEDAVREVSRAVAVDVMNHVPRDTNRMANGFAMAYNQLGVGPFAIQPLRGSRHKDLRQKELLKQIKRMKWLIRMKKENEQSVSPSLRRLETALRRAGEEWVKYAESKGTAVFVINIKDGRLLSKTVRTKVYGGVGTIARWENGNVVYTVRNKEPHASIRERVGKDAGWLSLILIRHGVATGVLRKRMLARMTGA